jgi:hypothetical protein
MTLCYGVRINVPQKNYIVSLNLLTTLMNAAHLRHLMHESVPGAWLGYRTCSPASHLDLMHKHLLTII